MPGALYSGLFGAESDGSMHSLYPDWLHIQLIAIIGFSQIGVITPSLFSRLNTCEIVQPCLRLTLKGKPSLLGPSPKLFKGSPNALSLG